MIDRYRLDANGVWINKATGRPMETPEGVFLPMMRSDTPSYISPVTGKPVDGRAARREDLKRSGSREVDPSEFKVTYENKKYADANRGDWEPRKTTHLPARPSRIGNSKAAIIERAMRRNY